MDVLPGAVEPALRVLVAEQFGVDVLQVTANVSLRDDLAADSLDMVELALAIERTFEVALPDAIIERVRTYDQLVVAMRSLVYAIAAPPTTPPCGDERPSF